MGIGHHLCADKRRLVVSGCDFRPVFPPGGRLVDAIGPEDGFVAGGPEYGYKGTKASGWSYSPF